ncbi:MAG: hypothetical protein WDW36_000210 [Sanguina aurantia]
MDLGWGTEPGSARAGGRSLQPAIPGSAGRADYDMMGADGWASLHDNLETPRYLRDGCSTFTPWALPSLPGPASASSNGH